MLLSQSCANLEASSDSNHLLEHLFIYACVLGVYHTNVVHKFATTGAQNYNPDHMEFLFVCWFTYLGPVNVQWANLKLNSLSFLPINSEDTFGFIDPANVLRGSHILPWFHGERVHADQWGLSRLANDKHDWCQYRVNQ